MKAYWKYTAAAMAVVAALSLTGCGQQTQQAELPQLVKPSRSAAKGRVRRLEPIRGPSKAVTRVICPSRPAAALRLATSSSARRSMPATS